MNCNCNRLQGGRRKLNLVLFRVWIWRLANHTMHISSTSSLLLGRFFMRRISRFTDRNFALPSSPLFFFYFIIQFWCYCVAKHYGRMEQWGMTCPYWLISQGSWGKKAGCEKKKPHGEETQDRVQKGIDRKQGTKHIYLHVPVLAQSHSRTSVPSSYMNVRFLCHGARNRGNVKAFDCTCICIHVKATVCSSVRGSCTCGTWGEDDRDEE